jgi:hypothetical protein
VQINESLHFFLVIINTAVGRMRYALINLRKVMAEKQMALKDRNYPSS